MAYSPSIPSSLVPYINRQTGLSVKVSALSTYYNIGASITIPKTGIMKMSVIGHSNSSSSKALMAFNLTRGGNTYQSNANYSATVSEFSSILNGYFNNTIPQILQHSYNQGTAVSGLNDILEYPVFANDVIQMIIADTGIDTSTLYIDDLLVIVQ